MNIFSALKVYASKWEVINERSFDPSEINAVKSAKVVSSTYGYSVCFLMKQGGETFIPLDTNSSLSEGDVVNLSTAKVITLHKDGEKDIFRIRE